jgi:molybdate transport system substrate-binding protein
VAPLMKRSLRLLLVPLTLLGLVAACGSDNSGGTSATTAAPAATAAVTTTAPTTAAATTTAAPTTTVPALKGDITVFAAASLTDSFKEVGSAFTKANPGATATFSFDASSALVQQIIQGAPADVFASADTANMDKLTQPGLNGTPPVVFATNLLAVIVPTGNPKGITGVADLANPDLKVVICAAEVPCGKYANQIFTTAGVTVTPVSLEQNVKGVVTKVTAGEADAGIVYTSDVKAAGDKADAVAIPAGINVVAKYPIASVKTSTKTDVDAAFISFLTGPDGQAIMAKYGFGKP